MFYRIQLGRNGRTSYIQHDKGLSCKVHCCIVKLFGYCKGAPHECVTRTGLLYTWVKAENEV